MTEKGRTAPHSKPRWRRCSATAATDHWAKVLEAADVPCGPVYNYAQLSIDPQVRHRGLVQYASDPELGEVPHIAPR